MLEAAAIGAAAPAEYQQALDDGRRGDPAELYAIWRGARDDAAIAYRRWSRSLARDDHAAYRAAADRADVAQDVLARVLRATR